MSPRRTVSTAKRVLKQLGHDPRTIALIFVVPCVLTILLKYVFAEQQAVFNSIAPLILGIFPLIVMFLVTAIATLRERTSGTLDRLMTMPIAKADLIFGYALAFSALAAIQASLTCAVILGVLGVPVQGGAILLLIGGVLAALLGTALGLFVSAFATSEFQAVQFMPAFIFPQLLTCGLFVPREHMATALQWFSNIMPLSYSVDAMRQVTLHTGVPSVLLHDYLIVGLFGIGALILGAVTIRRQE